MDPRLEVLDNAGRFLRAFPVGSLDPSEEWALFEGLMGHARELLALEMPATRIVARINADLADELANVGLSPRDVETIVASANGKLVGRVAIAWQNKLEADRHPREVEPDGEADQARGPSREWRYPEPLGSAAYCGPVGELVRVIEPHTEADPAALLLHSLAALGNIVGRKAYFLAEADHHYANLFVAMVGSTSKGRKGTSAGHVRRCFRMIDEEWAKGCNSSGLSSGEGLIWQVRDPIFRTEPVKEKGRVVDYQEVQVDAGISDKRLFLVETEMGQTLKVLAREGNSLSGTIRQAFDTGDLNTLVKNNPARSTGAHVSIVGHVTRDELVRNLSAVEAANGFANRFLWVCSKRARLLPEGGQLDDRDLIPVADELRRAAASWATATEVRIERDPKARELWISRYPDLSEGRAGLLGSVTSRAEAQVMRLALVYALADASRVIARAHLEAALEVWRFCFQSARYIFGDALGDSVADTILGALRDAGRAGMTRENLRELFSRNRTSSEIERALERLYAAGMVRRAVKEKGGRGRPAERWFAGPDAVNAENAVNGPASRIPASTAFTASPEPDTEVLG